MFSRWWPKEVEQQEEFPLSLSFVAVDNKRMSTGKQMSESGAKNVIRFRKRAGKLL